MIECDFNSGWPGGRCGSHHSMIVVVLGSSCPSNLHGWPGAKVIVSPRSGWIRLIGAAVECCPSPYAWHVFSLFDESRSPSGAPAPSSSQSTTP